MRPSDRDLVDVILGDAPDAVQDRVREAVTTPDVNSRYAKWSGLIASSRESRATAKLHRNIVNRTLARLKASHQVDTERMGSPARRSRALPLRWHPLRTMAVAALVPVAVSLYFLFTNAPVSPGGEALSESTPISLAVGLGEIETLHIDFSAGNSGDGSSAAPYGSLGQAINQSRSGSVLRIAAGSTPETLRFDKRMRIEAVNGKVQIGTF